MPIRWPRGLRRGSAAACLLGLWVRISPGTGKSVLGECFVCVCVCVCCQVEVFTSG